LRLIATQVLAENQGPKGSRIDQVITEMQTCKTEPRKFVSAIFASLVAGMPLTTVSHSAVPAADDCLSNRRARRLKASHWYYHIDRASKRHCWYLGDQREKLFPG